MLDKTRLRSSFGEVKPQFILEVLNSLLYQSYTHNWNETSFYVKEISLRFRSICKIQLSGNSIPTRGDEIFVKTNVQDFNILSNLIFVLNAGY